MRDPRDGKQRSTGTDVVEQATALPAKLRTEAFETDHIPGRAMASKRATLAELADWLLAEKQHKKSLKGRCTVPMASCVVDALMRFKAKRSRLSVEFNKLTRKLGIGIDDLRFHYLRHTACTRMRKAGIDLFTMASIPGYTSLEMLKRYQTISSEDQVAAIERVEKAQGVAVPKRIRSRRRHAG